jgi:hypothetical protein
MTVAFGIGLGSSVGLLGGDDTHKFMELVRMADGYGATAIGTYDSAFLGGDACVRATLVALAAPRAAVGLRPSNPLTREPQVMASFPGLHRSPHRHLGGRIGDGVIAGTGLLPEVITDTIARVHAGARAAGRDPAEVDIWFTARSPLHEDRERAIENVKASVSSILDHAMRFGLDGKHVPDDLRAKIQAYVDGYELYDHVLHAGRNPSTGPTWTPSATACG